MELELELRRRVHYNAEIWCEQKNLTLNSDDGVGRDVSSERGSTGVESSLRC